MGAADAANAAGREHRTRCDRCQWLGAVSLRATGCAMTQSLARLMFPTLRFRKQNSPRLDATLFFIPERPWNSRAVPHVTNHFLANSINHLWTLIGKKLSELPKSFREILGRS